MGLRHDLLGSKGLGQLPYFSSSALCSPSHRPRSAPVHSGCWPRSWHLRLVRIATEMEAAPSPMASCGLSSGPPALRHSTKPQLLSMAFQCLPNQRHLSDPYTLPSSAISIDTAVAPSGPWLLCADPEEIVPDFTSLMLVSF